MSDELDGLNEEGLAALKELQAEGHEIQGLPKEGEAKPAESPVEPKKDEPKPKDAPKPKEEGKPDTEAKPKEGEEPKADDDKGDDELGKPTPRKPVYVPVSKFNETRKELQAAKAAIKERDEALAKLQANPTEANKQEAVDAVKALVELGYEEEEASKVIKIIRAASPKTELDPTIAKRLEALDKWEATRAAEEAKMVQDKEQIAFEKDFQTVATEFPALAGLKQQIHEKAYSEGYEHTPLRAIAIELMHDMGYTGKKVKTAEQGGAGTGGNNDVLDFDNVSEEQFARFTAEQMDKFNEFQIAKERAARK